MSNRLDQEREARLQPIRMRTSITKLIGVGITDMTHDETMIQFEYNKQLISFWPYSGWHSGKGIVAGRGIDKLIKQLK